MNHKKLKKFENGWVYLFPKACFERNGVTEERDCRWRVHRVDEIQTDLQEATYNLTLLNAQIHQTDPLPTRSDESPRGNFILSVKPTLKDGRWIYPPDNTYLGKKTKRYKSKNPSPNITS